MGLTEVWVFIVLMTVIAIFWCFALPPPLDDRELVTMIDGSQVRVRPQHRGGVMIGGGGDGASGGGCDGGGGGGGGDGG